MLEETNENTRRNYTDLRGIYGYKAIAYFGLAWFTIWQSNNNFKALLIGVLIYLVGILFDFIIITKNNNGIRKKVLLCFVNTAKYVTFLVIVMILAFLLSDHSMDISWKEQVKPIIYTATVSLGLLSPVTDIYFNKPKDD